MVMAKGYILVFLLKRMGKGSFFFLGLERPPSGDRHTIWN